MPEKTRVLPRPTWTISENNLLPKYVEMKRRQLREHSDARLVELEQNITCLNDSIAHYRKALVKKQQQIAERETEIRQLQSLPTDLTDEEIRELFAEFCTSPEVLGSRIGMAGELILLVRPVIPGYEEFDWGTYEVGFDSYSSGTFVESSLNYHLLTGVLTRRLDSARLEITYENLGYRGFKGLTLVPANDLLKYNLKSLLVWLRNTLAEAVYYPRDYLRLATNRPELVWSGHLADPVPALRQLKNLVGVGSIGDVIDDLNRVNRLAKANAGEYRDAIRRMQVELREAEASLGAARRILTNQVEVDVEEARQELAIITAMPGVIAVHFVDGYLELHVRNSAVYRGTRYDLGDFTVSAKPHYKSILTIERSREPLGGHYNAGWHDTWFCFGNQATFIRESLERGDLVHAFNVALGAMNTVSEYDFEALEAGRLLARIPDDDVWTRKVRQRRRRKTRR